MRTFSFFAAIAALVLIGIGPSRAQPLNPVALEAGGPEISFFWEAPNTQVDQLIRLWQINVLSSSDGSCSIEHVQDIGHSGGASSTVADVADGGHTLLSGPLGNVQVNCTNGRAVAIASAGATLAWRAQ